MVEQRLGDDGSNPGAFDKERIRSTPATIVIDQHPFPTLGHGSRNPLAELYAYFSHPIFEAKPRAWDEHLVAVVPQMGGAGGSAH